MSQQPLYAGPALRRLRRQAELTQATMAARLQISPSYLNLLERNQRPLTTRVLMQLVAEFEVDPLALQPDRQIGGVAGLTRRLGDSRFDDLPIDRDEIEEFASTTPHIASAFARLYDSASLSASAPQDPLSVSRHLIEQWRNHFADLDLAAEQLADELRLTQGEIGPALVDYLRRKHQLSVRIVPQEVIGGAVRRLDLHARQVQLSELLPPASRTFQLAKQVALLEQRGAVEALGAGSELGRQATARILFERHLYSYFAAALVMPYSRFLRACQATGYDLHILQRRFGVSFEQLAHRLTTLQRVGERGSPFFMARVDPAGQFSKLFTGASGATFLGQRGSCPLWHLHLAFTRPGEWHLQRMQVDGASPADWITIARSTGSEESGARFAVALGVETRLAGELAQVNRSPALPVTPTGITCTRCHRPACRQRSRLPEGVTLSGERVRESSSPLSLLSERGHSADE